MLLRFQPRSLALALALALSLSAEIRELTPLFALQATLEQGTVTRVVSCGVIELAGLDALHALPATGEQSSSSNARSIYERKASALVIAHEVRKIVYVAKVPAAAPGVGARRGLVYLETCFTQVLSEGQPYAIVSGYHLTGLTPGAAYDIKIYAVNPSGAATPPARILLPPPVVDLQVLSLLALPVHKYKY